MFDYNIRVNRVVDRDESELMDSRADIVNRLMADNPTATNAKTQWLKDHEVDVLVLIELEGTIFPVAEMLGMSYATIGAWKRLEAEMPSRKGLSESDETPRNYGARVHVAAMEFRENGEKAEPQKGVDIKREYYVPAIPGVDLPEDPAALEQPSEILEEQENTQPDGPDVFQCDLCPAQYPNKAGLGGHQFSVHGIRGKSRRRASEYQTPADRTPEEDILYWKGKYEGAMTMAEKFLQQG